MSADNARLGHAMEAGLDHTQLHLWLVFPERIRDEALLQRYREVLSAAERARIGRFHFPQDRHSYLLTRAASRMVLSKYAPVAPEDWQFSVSSHGRPQIINTHPDAASLSFNISHTAGLIAIGVTRHNAIGIDVENMQRRPAPLDIARSCFAPDECAALQAQHPERRGEWFYRTWTLKESYVKARGLGLSIPLDQFSFHLADGAPGQPVNLAAAPSVDDDPLRWAFWQFRVAGDYIVAACMQRTPAARQTLSTLSIVPLRSEEEQHSDCLAAPASDGSVSSSPGALAP